jgi:hypothetical protein
MSLGDVITLLGASGGGGILGFLGAAVGREASFNRRIDAELSVLRNEVALCREERTQFAIVKMGSRMMVRRLREIDDADPVLAAVASAFEQLPEDDSMAELLQQLGKERDGDEQGS